MAAEQVAAVAIEHEQPIGRGPRRFVREPVSQARNAAVGQNPGGLARQLVLAGLLALRTLIAQPQRRQKVSTSTIAVQKLTKIRTYKLRIRGASPCGGRICDRNDITRKTHVDDRDLVGDGDKFGGEIADM